MPAKEQNSMSFLEKYTKNLNKLAEQGKLDPVISRDKEIRRLIQILSRRTKNNPVLVGEPGVGKTAIAEGLALKIINQDVPRNLLDKQILALDLAALVAGSKFRGEFEERLKGLISDLKKEDSKYLLFIDELHTLVGAGRVDGAMDAGQLLKPALAKGELRAIGATTLAEYRQFIEKDQALERRFQKIYIREPSVEDTITILRGLKEKYELHHGIRIKDSALQAAAKFSERYISDRFLPDKAIDLIDEACSKLQVEMHSLPSFIDEKHRKIKELKVERQALSKESDSSSKKRVLSINKDLEKLEKEYNKELADLEKERQLILKLRSIKKQIEDTKFKISQAEREVDLEKAAELKYGDLPELEKQLEKQEALVKNQNNTTFLKEQVEVDDIAQVISQWTGVPIAKMMQSETKKLLALEEELKKRIIGQDKACSLLSQSIRRARAEISDPYRPIGSFIFLGSTGVGKTETAKALSEVLFDNRDAFIRLDMSEYMEKHQVSRLLGAPPGYVGYEEGGQLTEKVRREPYSLILIDEIEKAHPEVFNILLQILDEGHLTDSQGRRVNFKNTLLIITSNLQEADLKSHFRPEFLNRIDEVVIFNRLKEKEVKKIVKLQLKDLEKRLKEKQISLNINDSALKFLSEKGFDSEYGARPVRRAIQKNLLNPLSEHILSGKIKPGQRVSVKANDINLQFV